MLLCHRKPPSLNPEPYSFSWILIFIMIHDHDHDGDDIDGSSPPDCTEDNAEYEAENEKADDDEKSNV